MRWTRGLLPGIAGQETDQSGRGPVTALAAPVAVSVVVAGIVAVVVSVVVAGVVAVVVVALVVAVGRRLVVAVGGRLGVAFRSLLEGVVVWRVGPVALGPADRGRS